MKESDEERLLELLESGSESDLAGLADAEASAVEAARRGLALAREAGEVEDPGELFWRRFEQQVGQALPARRRLPGPVWLAAAAALIAVSVSWPRLPPPLEEPLWHALPESDTSLEVLAGLEDAGRALEPETACPVEECVLELDESESRAFAALLRRELEGRKS